MAGARRARGARPPRPARCWSSGSRSIRDYRRAAEQLVDRARRCTRTSLRLCGRAKASRATDAWTPGADGRACRRMPAAGPHAAGLLDADPRPGDGRARTLSERRSGRAVRCARRRASSEVCAAADALRAETSRRPRRATSSPATSTTPTSALYRCSFCAFSKGKTHENLRGPRLRPRRWTRSRAAAAKPGSAARPKSACRAASIRDYTGETYLVDLPRHQGGRAGTAHPRLLAARDLAGRRDARHDACRSFSAS